MLTATITGEHLALTSTYTPTTYTTGEQVDDLLNFEIMHINAKLCIIMYINAEYAFFPKLNKSAFYMKFGVLFLGGMWRNGGGIKKVDLGFGLRRISRYGY